MKVVAVQNKEDLRNLVHQERKPRLLCLGLDGLSSDPELYPGNLDVLWFFALQGQTCPWIAFSRKNGSISETLCSTMGASGYLTQPLEQADMIGAIRAGLTSSTSESSTLSLVLFLLLAQTLRVTALIHVTNAVTQEEGILGLEQGDVCYARCRGEDNGEASLRSLLSWPKVELQVKQKLNILSRNVEISLEEVLATQFPDAPMTPATSTLQQGASVVPAEEHNIECFNTQEFDSVCQEILEGLSGADACGIVRCRDETLVGFSAQESLASSIAWDKAILIVSEMFQSEALQVVKQEMARQEEQVAQDNVQEIFILASHSSFFMKALEGLGLVVVLVTQSTTSQGMGWAHLRSAVDGIQTQLS
ncbi:MAG: DUF4388 domain-containing protein [Deltaproteobacteria bacterium]|nr:MAG: DUF4388 domain-containing protein [Deltaproteobacteria bacterium]